MKRPLLLTALGSCLLLLGTGCVTGRRTMSLPVQAFGAPTNPKADIKIESVTDNRRFENKPTEPFVPSVNGDVAALSPQEKNTMIGRQRNTYGKAMGDVALPAGDSVTNLARLLVEQGLQQRGYRIVRSGSTPITAKVAVDQFWGWSTPGMFSIAFEAQLQCTLTLQKGEQTKTVTVLGYGKNNAQVAKDANWQLAYDRAFKDFTAKMGPALDQAGF
jgi:hypothetical protein